jgi:small subunit ribosomal protein S1
LSNLIESVPEGSLEEFSKLLEASFEKNACQEGQVIQGTVVGVESDTIVVDVGMKTEGRIPSEEFCASGKDHDLVIGDTVDVYLERIENALGDAVLSREKARREESWTNLLVSQKENKIVEGVINGKVKGGFTVDLDGAQAFLPGSQVDVRPIRDMRPLMYTTQTFHILKMDRRRGNIVVSRKSVLSESLNVDKSELLGKLKEGEILEGIVKNITDYGAFVDLGGIDGLLHVTDISWKRISSPSEVINIGEKIKVVITKVSEENMRISLGMKQLQSDPWVEAKNKYTIGERYKGRVTNIADYGAFVELEGGIEGLVHVSEMSWVSKIQSPNKYVSANDVIEVMILEIDIEKKRLSLGLKQCANNPWEDFAQKNPIGTKLKGKIQNITDFGLFVQVSEELDGLVHMSDIDWRKSGSDAIKDFEVGQDIDAIIIDIEPHKERISLGIKQLDGDPMASLDEMKKGTVVTCTVVLSQAGGIEVEIGDKIPAFIKRGDLSKDKSEQNPDRFEVGQKVDAKVTSLDPKTRRISLSIRALEISDEKKAIEQYGSKDSGASLGDILGEALDKSSSSDVGEVDND